MKAVMLILAGGLAMPFPSRAEVAPYESGDRIAAHFEALSSRLRAEDVVALERFVSRAENTPGAKLAILIPNTAEPARTRFVAARIAELERNVRSLSGAADYRRVPDTGRGDILWLTMALPEPVAVSQPTALAPSFVSVSDSAPPVQPTTSPPIVATADLQLSDWVIRGVKHPAHGPTYAYVAKMGTTDPPHEIVEAQTDKDLGLIKEISLSAEGLWIVHTEIGWIGQVAP